MPRQFHPPTLRHRLKAVLLIPLAANAIAVSVAGRPVLHLALTAWSDRDQIAPLPAGTVDDASRLNQTRMQIVRVPSDLTTAQGLLRNLLQQAKLGGQKVAIAGSRHTMGGQTIYLNGIALEMAGFNQMQLNPATKIFL
jgi:hypothetical protein